MDLVLGGLQARLERPQTRKFRWPIVIFPELFASFHHMTILTGYLVSVGWEVYLLDVYTSPASLRLNTTGASTFAALVKSIRIALADIGSEVVTIGHGLGGLLALKIAECSRARAAVALAPLVPGFRSPLLVRTPRWRLWRLEGNRLPARRRLFELLSEADPFQRDALVKALTPMNTSAAEEVAGGAVKLAAQAAPRMVITGEADVFAPAREVAQFAAEIDAHFVSLPGRGHWLIGGRALERTVAHMQRFLVRALGQDLLLLYDEASRPDPDA